MKPHAAVLNKRDLLEKSRGWMETLDWLIEREPGQKEAREALSRARNLQPSTLRGRLHRQGQIEALEWFLG